METHLNSAYEWLYKQRKRSCANNDLWHIRRHWDKILPDLIEKLRSNTYCFMPMRLVIFEGRALTVTEGLDSLVLRALTTHLEKELSPHLSKKCTHLKGHGGIQWTVYEVFQALPYYTFLYKSDAYSYYASINHEILMNQLKTFIRCRKIWRLVRLYCERLLDIDGILHHTNGCGIPLGCSLSPLMGALYMTRLDKVMERRTDIFYIRYMDDWIIMGRQKCEFKRTIKLCKQILTDLKLKEHPDKTVFMRIDKMELSDKVEFEKIKTLDTEITEIETLSKLDTPGIDFLGYHITKDRIRIKNATCSKILEKIDKLYLEGDALEDVEQYVKRAWHPVIKQPVFR